VAEVAALRQVQAHEAAVRAHQRRVHGEVGRAAGQRLHVARPARGILAEHF